MDLYTGGDFHCDVAPFPDSGDLLYEQPLDRLNSPPQKLRPIRCSGRWSAVCEVGGAQENGGVVDGESSLKLEPVGQLLRMEDCCLHMEDLVGVGVGPGSGNSDPNGVGCLLGLESRSSLDDDGTGNSLGTTKEPLSRKRRKKMVRKLRDFVGNLVMKVMEKQEQMHKQLVDMIEKKERERLMREEAWKQKEMERIKKDEEARAQEISRNLALISSIQKLLGQEIQILQPAVSSEREEEDGDVNIQKDFKSDLNNKRWPEVEVQGSKGSVWEWEEISGKCLEQYQHCSRD